MFSKNLKYYRLKNRMTKKELASLAGLTPMAITHYENGERVPDIKIIENLAEALHVKVSDFLARRNEDLKFVHCEFRKSSKLSASQQSFVRESVEEYLSRFFDAVEILGGDVFPHVPSFGRIPVTEDAEQDAGKLRRFLGFPENGPIGNLVGLLENKGIPVIYLNVENDAFSGMNGTVNGRPYIALNENMSPERIRSTAVHELAHFFFSWPEETSEKEREKCCNAISAAFLLPAYDVKREAGLKRTSINYDMTLICREYGISMYVLVERADVCSIISRDTANNFFVSANRKGWKKNEPVRINKEVPLLFQQLVFRAVCENEITVQKGAELLRMPYSYVSENCMPIGE